MNDPILIENVEHMWQNPTIEYGYVLIGMAAMVGIQGDKTLMDELIFLGYLMLSKLTDNKIEPRVNTVTSETRILH